MKRENQKAAAERRVRQQKSQKQKKSLVIGLIVLLIVAAIGLAVYALGRRSNSGASSGTTRSDRREVSSETLPQQNGVNTDTNYEVKSGDTVAIHYIGKLGDQAFYGGTGDYNLTLGSGSFIPGFEDQVIGHKIGETFDVHVTFPAGYSSSYAMDASGKADQTRPLALSNADATFTVTIRGVVNK